MGWRQGPVLIQLHQIRTQRIQQTLGVSEDRARAIADRWTRFDQDSMERHRQMRAAENSSSMGFSWAQAQRMRRTPD